MEGEQISTSADRGDLLQLLWTTTTTSANTCEDIYLNEPIREIGFELEQHEILALNKELSESAPDLSNKSVSDHCVTPQRLCKSADTLLAKNHKQFHHRVTRGYGRTTNKRLRGNTRCRKRNISSPKQKIPAEMKVLQIGNLKQRTAPLDYTLCLADYQTKWNLDGYNPYESDNKEVTRLNIDCFAKALNDFLIGYAILRETSTGSIVAQFTNLEDLHRVIRLPLANIFGTKVKSWRILNRCPSMLNQNNPYQKSQLPQYYQTPHPPSLPSTCCHSNNYISYRRYLIAPDIPDTVPSLEIQNALRFQGLRTGQVLRHKPSGFSIEVLRPYDYDRLCRDGVNFFNVAAFPVYASLDNVANRNAELDGKWLVNKNVGFDSKSYNPTHIHEIIPEIPFAILQDTQHRENIQCFKCQRYGHKATHCKYWTRCVRCGGRHKVADCDISMTAASCCLCKGAHHAASHECPVHNVHANAVQVTFAMARTNLKSTSTFGVGGNNW